MIRVVQLRSRRAVGADSCRRVQRSKCNARGGVVTFEMPLEQHLNRFSVVCPRHSILRASTDGVLCEDVGSLNGTFVNEDRMDGPSKLVAGDVLQFGQSAVRVCAV